MAQTNINCVNGYISGIRILIFTLCVIGVLPSVAHSRGAGIEWNVLNQEVQDLYRAGKYTQAVVVALEALGVAEENVGPDHPHVALSLSYLALLYDNRGDYTKAEPLYKRSLAIDEKALGPDHPSVATDLHNLASLYYALGDYAKAEPLYKRSLAIWEKALGPYHPEVATSLEHLAALYRATRRGAKAEALEQRAAKIRTMKR